MNKMLANKGEIR